MGKCSAFCAGAVVGLAAGLFLAPKSGPENLADAQEKVRELLDQGQEYCMAGAQRFQSSVSAASSSDQAEKLQAKIDAARKIIAEQVSKNAVKDASDSDVVETSAIEEEAAEEENAAE